MKATSRCRCGLERTICLIAGVIGLVLVLASSGDGQERPTPPVISELQATLASTTALSESIVPDMATGALLVIGVSFFGAVRRKAAQVR